MGLSEREQQILEQIEDGLRRNDPRLATRFSRPSPGRPPGLAASALGMVASIALLLAGVSLDAAWVGVGGFCLAVVCANRIASILAPGARD